MKFKDKQYEDEFTFIQMCLAIEQSFGFEFIDTEILELDSIEELVKLIQNKRAKKTRPRKKQPVVKK